MLFTKPYICTQLGPDHNAKQWSIQIQIPVSRKIDPSISPQWIHTLQKRHIRSKHCI